MWVYTQIMNLLCYCTWLRNAARRMTAIYGQALAPVGVGTAQFSLLRELEGDGEAIGLSELGELLDLDRSTVGRNVGVLERMGLVRIGVGVDQRLTTIELKECWPRRIEGGRAALGAGSARA
jgi:DNA-binding MarR family transcriptional regulator